MSRLHDVAFYAMLVCIYAFLCCFIVAMYRLAPDALARLAIIPAGGFILLAPVVLFDITRRRG